MNTRWKVHGDLILHHCTILKTTKTYVFWIPLIVKLGRDNSQKSIGQSSDVVTVGLPCLFAQDTQPQIKGQSSVYHSFMVMELHHPFFPIHGWVYGEICRKKPTFFIGESYRVSGFRLPIWGFGESPN